MFKEPQNPECGLNIEYICEINYIVNRTNLKKLYIHLVVKLFN